MPASDDPAGPVDDVRRQTVLIDRPLDHQDVLALCAGVSADLDVARRDGVPVDEVRCTVDHAVAVDLRLVDAVARLRLTVTRAHCGFTLVDAGRLRALLAMLGLDELAHSHLPDAEPRPCEPGRASCRDHDDLDGRLAATPLSRQAARGARTAETAADGRESGRAR